MNQECCVCSVFAHVNYCYLCIIGEEAMASHLSSPIFNGPERAFCTGRARGQWQHTTIRVVAAKRSASVSCGPNSRGQVNAIV